MSATAMHRPEPLTVTLESRGGKTVRVSDLETKETLELADSVFLKAQKVANDPKRESGIKRPKWWRFW